MQQFLGSNQVSLKDYNERIILQLLRHSDGMTQADIARTTCLTAQTVSKIIRRFHSLRLIVKGTPVSGKIGQPSVPIWLNPDIAYAIGLSIGRHHTRLICIDFSGRILKNHNYHWYYDFAEPAFVRQKTQEGITKIIESFDTNKHTKIAGVGVSIPNNMTDWKTITGVTTKQQKLWENIDITTELQQQFGSYQVEKFHDVSSACYAELLLGRKQNPQFLYLFLGTLLSGQFALKGRLFNPHQDMHPLLTTMPMWKHGQYRQLIETVSLLELEKRLLKAGIDPNAIYQDTPVSEMFTQEILAWTEEVADALSWALISTVSVFYVPVVVLEANLSREILLSIVTLVNDKLRASHWEGLSLPTVEMGQAGRHAKALGAGLMLVNQRYELSDKTLLKQVE